MKNQSALILCLGLLVALPTQCDEKGKEEVYDVSGLMPLGAMYHRAHGWLTAADYEAIGKRNSLEEEAPDPPFDEIALERASCAGFGICPSDSLRFLRSGEVFYWGDAHVKRTGCFKAKNPAEDLAWAFDVFAEILAEIEIWDMDDKYATRASHGSSAYYSVVRGHERRVIWNYDEAAPVELFLFEEYLLQWMEELKWKKVRRADSAAECLGLSLELVRQDHSRSKASVPVK